MAAHVVVFAPAPQLTVTVEQPSDTAELHLHAGGQGIWQARMITSLGVPVTLCATAGGEVGKVLELLIADEGITPRVINRGGASGWYVHDRREGSRRLIADAAGPPLSRHELDELYGLTLAEGLRAPVSVLSGPSHPSVISADVYRRLAKDLTGNDCQVVADLSGDHLSAVLEGGVSFLKVSHEELIEHGRAADDSVDELVKALLTLRSDGARNVLISRAEEPALALVDDEILEVRMPRLEAADPRGAGDSMTAGVAAVLARNGSLHDALRTGAAAGAVNTTRHGLGTGRADAIGELVDRVRLDPVRSARKGP
jgi:1-phosphofructokinase